MKTHFPIIDTPVNSTTAIILQKSKPQNDYDEQRELLACIQRTRKRILSCPNTPIRKLQLKSLGAKEQKIIKRISTIKKQLSVANRFDVHKCFVEICHNKMSREQFFDTWQQAIQLVQTLKGEKTNGTTNH